MSQPEIIINRAPVLTLWATTVAERMGFDPDAALSLGKAVAGLTAQSKGRHLGIFKPGRGPNGKPLPKHGLGEELWIQLCGRSIPAKNTPGGLRAVAKEKIIEPGKVRVYLNQKFGDDLSGVRRAMEQLAGAHDPDDLIDTAFALYENFRPSIPPGTRGWGAKGKLDLKRIRSLAG